MKTKNKLLILIIFLFIIQFSVLNSQNTWLQTYDPFYEAIFSVEDVLVCSDGGYAVNGTCINQETAMGWGFVIKTDCDGNLLWAKKDTVSFQPENDSRAFVETEDGTIISASYHYTNGTALIKRDTNGNRDWVCLLEDIKIESIDKNIYNEIIISGINFPNAMLAKINENGEIVWQNIFEFENYEWGNIKSVVKSTDGGYLLTGYVEDIETENAVLVIKTDANGDSLWTRILDETLLDDKGKTIIETENGDIIVGGYLEGITAGFLWKLDSEGNTIWLETGIENCGYGFTSFVKSSDNSIVSIFGDTVFDNSLRKFDSDYNIEWTNNLPYYSGHGDKAVEITSEGNIVVALLNASSSTIGLIKLNPDGTDIDVNLINISKTTLNAYPNPFNPSINFSFDLEKNSEIKLKIFNAKGQLVSSIDKGIINSGKHIIPWQAVNLSSGIYFTQLQVNNKVIDSKKIILLK